MAWLAPSGFDLFVRIRAWALWFTYSCPDKDSAPMLILLHIHSGGSDDAIYVTCMLIYVFCGSVMLSAPFPFVYCRPLNFHVQVE